jgi:hypothetical protein
MKIFKQHTICTNHFVSFSPDDPWLSLFKEFTLGYVGHLINSFPKKIKNPCFDP